jgi:hypothetical protein
MTDVATVPPTAAVEAAPHRMPRWRRWTAGALIVISCILVPLSVLSIWVRNQLLNTDRYVENVKPLATNPSVINTAATNVTNALYDQVNVQQVIEDALPPRADFLASPISSGLRQVIEQATTRIMESDQFQRVWLDANRLAHEQVVKALTNQGQAVKTENGHIVLDLSALLTQVRDQLVQNGLTIFSRIPINHLNLKIELADAKQLERAQTATRILNRLAWLLPVLAILCLIGGLLLSPHWRKSLIKWGVGTAFAVLLIGAALSVGRSIYLDAVTSPQLPRDTAAAVFDTLVRFLRQGVRLMIAVALIVAIAAWITGPTAVATRIRTTSRRVVGNAGGAAGEHGVGFGAFGDWVATHKTPVRIGAVLAALAVLLLWNHPKAITVVSLAILLVIAFGLIEFIARAAAADGRPPAERPTGASGVPPIGSPPSGTT